MQHYKYSTTTPRDKASLEEGFFLLQSLQSFQQTGQFLQYDDSEKNPSKKNVQNDPCKKAVSSIFEGQSFPFRLYHLINNEFFQDVIHWSIDGNSLIIPSEIEFTLRVLKRPIQRIFKTESMKSFVRQLNLYGFHKVSLDKDDTFAYIRARGKDLWPDAVFNHPCFTKGRPELLDHVKRRCKVKQAKALTTGKIKGKSNIFRDIELPLSTQPFPNLFNFNREMSFPNVLSPKETSLLDRKDTKRKLNFIDDRDNPAKKLLPIHQIAAAAPYYIFPPPQVNSQVQPTIPPPGWPFLQQHQPLFPSYNMIQPALGVHFLRSSSQPCTPKENESNQQKVNDQIAEITPPQSIQCRTEGAVMMSPIDKFCAEIFQPGSLDNTPSRNININEDGGFSQIDS